MLWLDFASRGFYFCAYCAAFARVVILSAHGAARFWRAKFYELARRRGFLRFTEYDFTDWQRKRGFLWGVIFSWLCSAVFKLWFHEPTARHNFASYGFCRLRTYEPRICFCETGFDFKLWRGFASRTTADSRLSAALARRHPIWKHIKYFEILFIKS